MINNSEDSFAIACRYGNLDTVKLLLNSDLDIDIHRCNYYEFRRACAYGCIEIAKQLEILGADIGVNGNVAFRHAASYGHIDIIKWLYSLSTDTYDNRAIKWACKNGYIDVVKWLFSIDPTNINNVTGFKWTCCHRYLEIAKWLIQADPSILAKCVSDIDQSILYQLDLSKQTLDLLLYVTSSSFWYGRKANPSDYIHNTTDIDEIFLHTLCINNMQTFCDYVTDNFPHITFERNTYGKISSYNIPQLNIKSARNI